jgi:hypothetical protein
MLFQQLVNMIFRNGFVASLLTSCYNAVPTTFQQDFSQRVCSKLVNKLWQCCSNNLSTRCLLNRLLASLLTSCDNAVPTTCQHFGGAVVRSSALHLWDCGSGFSLRTHVKELKDIVYLLDLTRNRSKKCNFKVPGRNRSALSTWITGPHVRFLSGTLKLHFSQLFLVWPNKCISNIINNS